ETELQKLPIIVFSNTYLTNMVQEAWKAGATKCLSKANCSPKQLIEVIRSTLASSDPGGAGQIGRAAVSPATTPPQPAPTASAPPRNEQDAEFQAGLRKTFVDGLPATLAGLRT